MSSRTIILWGLALFIGALGLLRFVAKDWLWDRHESLLRARGLVNLERTPEWDQQQNFMGAALLVVALVLIVAAAALP